MAVYDTETRQLIPQVYSWDDYTQWDPGADLTWNYLDGSYTSSLGVPDLTFTTEIIDFGRTAYINPLCTAITSGTHTIKVYAADAIDSSSQLPGDPVIVASSAGQVLTGVQGRYFQFVVEVFDGVDSFVRGVQTNLSSTQQTEIIAGDSSTHAGTQAARIAPLTREYSRITGVVGNAKADTNLRPILTIGNNTTQAVYTIYNLADTETGQDSSTVTAIADFTENVTITESGSVTAVEDEYKWQPSAIRFNTFNGTTVTDTNDKITFSAPNTSNTFTYEMWMKLAQDGVGEPGYQHSEYFLEIPTAGNSIRVRTNTSSNGMRLDISTDGGSTFINGSNPSSQGYAPNIFRHIAIVQSGGTIKGYIDGTLSVSTSSTASPSGTVSIGDLGSSSGQFYMDDFRISDTARYTANFLTPGEFVVDGNTKVLINGVEPITVAVLSTTVSLADATVNLLVSGLPKMVTDANNNIVEVST